MTQLPARHFYFTIHTHTQTQANLSLAVMKSPVSTYGRRTPSTGYGYRSTPDRFHYSPGSSYSDASSVKKPTKNTVTVAAKSVFGVFFGCFTPPHESNMRSSKSFEDSDELRPPCVLSNASGRGKERRSSSSSDRGIYGKGYHNTSERREPANARFSLDEIYHATKNFSPSFKIGQGGFGIVYKGKLSDGSLVAIKRAKKSVYDRHAGAEFQSEVRTLAQVEHLNLVRFYGYIEHDEERILVVEYVPNGTLREHLDCLHGVALDMPTRLDIAIDVAHAITYLHMYADHPIIHRDIKSSNILLTENFRAKVADFGFARLGADSESGATHVSTQVKGTAGYLDPEYLKTNQLTDKSDVYSFGVLLVELVTARRPIEPKHEMKERITPRWAMKKFTEGKAISIMDLKLEHTATNKLALEKILELSLQCLAPRRPSRPSMRRCAEILWNIRKDYREQSASDFCPHFPSSRSSSVKEVKLNS